MVAAKIDNEKRPACAIIGAGIAGLSAAIALRRAGWDVEVCFDSWLVLQDADICSRYMRRQI